MLVWIRENGKLVGYKKSGEFDFQATSKELVEATDIYFDEIKKLLFILRGSEIFVGDLL